MGSTQVFVTGLALVAALSVGAVGGYAVGLITAAPTIAAATTPAADGQFGSGLRWTHEERGATVTVPARASRWDHEERPAGANDVTP
jgi:hypothetical protein